MKIIDRYILQKYLQAFLFVVIILVVVVCVIDYTEKNQDFIEHNLSWGKILGSYYINFALYIANLLAPITVFIATVFVTAKLATHSEIIAMLNSGMSFRRMLVPYLIGSSAIAVLIFILIGWYLPKANKERLAFEVQYVWGEKDFEDRNVHMRIAPKYYIYFESYNKDLSTGYRFTLEKIEETELKMKISAKKFSWLEDQKKWRIHDFKQRIFNDSTQKLKWGTALDTSLNIRPKDIEKERMEHETMTLTALNKFIKKQKMRGVTNIEPYLIEKYERITYPFAIIILTMMGVMVSARKSRQGTGFKIALGFVLAFIYILMVIVGRNIASVGAIPPYLSAWIPNIVFTIIGLFLYWRAPK